MDIDINWLLVAGYLLLFAGCWLLVLLVSGFQMFKVQS